MSEVLATLLIYEGQYEIRQRTRDGAEVSKFVAPTDVAAAFRHEPLDTGWIPSCVVRAGSTTRGRFAVGWFPPRRHTCGLMRPDGSVEPVTVPLPGLVLLGMGASYLVWATGGEEFRPDAAASHAPLPNVNGDGAICFGVHTTPRATPDTIATAFSTFINSPFNDHLVNGKSRAFPDDVRAQLRALGGRTSYPLRDLVRVGRTVAQLVEREVGR